jgi:hypothetical protein
MGDDVERIRRAAPKIADRRYRHGGGSLCPETDLAGQAGEIAEAALAHLVGDAAERAYRRGDALEKRRAMMEMGEDQFAIDGQRRAKPRVGQIADERRVAIGEGCVVRCRCASPG